MPVKEHPILFSAPMVRAILECRKTQTRRVIKKVNKYCLEVDNNVDDPPFVYEHEQNCEGCCDYGCRGKFIDCPYGKPGDRLWVRETFRKSENPLSGSIYYRADEEYHKGAGWKPSIFMPRWASRIDLEILSIRVERLQDISEEDARAEGVQLLKRKGGGPLVSISDKHSPLDYVEPMKVDETATDAILRAWTYKAHFAALWDSINAAPKPCYGKVDGKKVITHYVSYPWEDIQETRTHRGKPWHVIGNPWNWVIEFKRVEGV